MGVVCFLGIPRTGSSQLVRVVESFRGIASFGELFHSVRPRQLRRLAARTGLPVEGLAADAALEFLRGDPTRVMDAIQAHAIEGQWQSFKLFDSHLPLDTAMDEVVRRAEVVPIFLRRRVIDSYASKLKANALTEWHTTDTTEVTVEGDIDSFVRWVDRSQRWYQRCAEVVEARGLAPHTVTYETDIDVPTAQSAQRVAAVLQGAGVAVRPGGEVDAMQKQDTARAWERKFSNAAEFRAALVDRDLLSLAEGYFV